MVLDPVGLLLFIVIAVIPAYYFNKWIIRLTNPKKSFVRLMIYFILCVMVAMIYSAIVIFIITRFQVIDKK